MLLPHLSICIHHYPLSALSIWGKTEVSLDQSESFSHSFCFWWVCIFASSSVAYDQLLWLFLHSLPLKPLFLRIFVSSLLGLTLCLSAGWDEAYVFFHNSFSFLNISQISNQAWIVWVTGISGLCYLALCTLTYLDENANIATDLDIKKDLV